MTRKKAFSLIGKEDDPERISELLLAADFKPEEIQEFLAILADETAEENKPAEKESENSFYEEWRCEIKVNKRDENDAVGVRVLEKVKRTRTKVGITEEEAETLNAGAINSPRQDYVIAYFKPE